MTTKPQNPSTRALYTVVLLASSDNDRRACRSWRSWLDTLTDHSDVSRQWQLAMSYWWSFGTKQPSL